MYTNQEYKGTVFKLYNSKPDLIKKKSKCKHNNFQEILSISLTTPEAH